MNWILKLTGMIGIMMGSMGLVWPANGSAAEGRGSSLTSEAVEGSDPADESVILLEPVQVHAVPLNKAQQVGPVPKHTPWPTVPSSLQGRPLDEWMKARLLVSKEAEVTVVVLESTRYLELTQAGLDALQQWTFDPQMKGDQPVDGQVTVRIHFRTQ